MRFVAWQESFMLRPCESSFTWRRYPARKAELGTRLLDVKRRCLLPRYRCHLRKHLMTEKELSMTNSSRVTKIGFLAFGILLLTSAAWAQNCPPSAEKMAKA